MAALQRLAHELHVADALEGVVGAAVGQIDQMGDEIALNLGGIDEVGHAEVLRQARFAVDVDADNHVGADQPGALDDVETDAAEAEDDAVGPGSTFAVLMTAPMPVVTPQPM